MCFWEFLLHQYNDFFMALQPLLANKEFAALPVGSYGEDLDNGVQRHIFRLVQRVSHSNYSLSFVLRSEGETSWLQVQKVAGRGLRFALSDHICLDVAINLPVTPMRFYIARLQRSYYVRCIIFSETTLARKGISCRQYFRVESESDAFRMWTAAQHRETCCTVC